MASQPPEQPDPRVAILRHVIMEAMRKGGSCWFKAKHLATELGWGRQSAKKVSQCIHWMSWTFPGGSVEVEDWGRSRSTTYKFTLRIFNRAAVENWLWGAPRTPTPASSSSYG